jgi:hypothetical protein
MVPAVHALGIRGSATMNRIGSGDFNLGGIARNMTPPHFLF